MNKGFDESAEVEVVENGYAVGRPQEVPRPTPEQLGKKAAGLVKYSDIVRAREMPRKELYVPDWGGFIVIQAFTRLQAEKLRSESRSENEQGQLIPDQNLAERLTLQLGVIQPHFTRAEIEEIFEMNPAWLIEGILKEIALLNASVAQALEEANKRAEYSFRP